MKNIRSHRSHIVAFLVFIISVVSAAPKEEPQTSEILVRRFSHSNSSSGIVPKILKVTQTGHEEVVHVPEIHGEPLFTLKSDPVKVQSDFKTIDISVLNRQRDKENAKKVAIIQQDLQSRIKVNEPESSTQEPVEEITESETVDPEEVMRKQARVKEDIESRVFADDDYFRYRDDGDREEKLHYPVKRSDDDYYADEPEPVQQARMTTEAPKEEDSFFSIFESLFGSSDDDTQTKKKAHPEDEPMFKEAEDPNLKENIKTVGEILKPLKPVDEPEFKTQNVFSGYQSDGPEYRIVNNFHASQVHKATYKPPEPKPSYHNFYRPTEKPFRPYKPHSTNGYEDYDLDEFSDKSDPTTIRVKYVSPSLTTVPVRNDPTTTTTTTTTTSTLKTTTKNNYDNKLKFPSVQKKNDYINRNRYQEVKNEATEKRPEKVTERTTIYQKPETKPTTTEIYHYSRPNYETKINEIKPHKIQESPNFYNLINLPVRYSTKDTAIPLISTSYANTKIQGMGAQKYEKGSNGKYPNHKYDSVNTSTTKKPNYWATKRTSTEKSTTSFRPSQLISKTTTKYYTPGTVEKADYDDFSMGMGPEFGGYGSKTGAEIKTQAPSRQTPSTTLYKETTTRRNVESKLEAEASQTQGHYRPNTEQSVVKIKEIERFPEKTSIKPVKEYEEYDYESFPAQVQEVQNKNPNQPPNYPASYLNKETQQQKNELDYKVHYQTIYNKDGSVTSMTDGQKTEEIPEYEYYDYEDISTTTTTTTTAATTPKYKIKYPSLAKDKIKTASSEKVAVVVPSKNHEFYENQTDDIKTSTTPEATTTTTTTTTTTMKTTTTEEPKPPQTTTNIKITEPEVYYKKPTTQYYKPNQFYKEPAPVFEVVKEQEEQTTKENTISTKKIYVERPTTTEATVKPVIVTSATKEQENNVNIVLIPTKETIKNVEVEEKFSQPEPPRPEFVHNRPSGSFQSNYDFTTEFTVGAVQGGNPKPQIHGSNQGGHFVATSISANPYEDDEPFRPIPQPPGFVSTTSFQVVHKEPPKQPPKNPPTFQNKRPLPTPPVLKEPDHGHEPHEFIPSPQFHRPVEPKPSGDVRPGSDVDYDFEGIQTEPKPGQYVIFSKPQLNPEMNENQLKKKSEIKTSVKGVSNVPHFHEKVSQFGQENQKQGIFKEGQVFSNAPKPKPSASDKMEQGRPIFGNIPELTDDRLSLQLVPPRGTQTEKPFEGNFVLPEIERQESTVSYPRPHWEKNGKPSFLMPNKNELHGNRHPPMPPQMAPTLIPPSSIPPQRFRRPLQPHMPPMRKNFNEAGTNIKPKPNLPNILPQFRPNAKVGSGPYHRPPGHINPNRRNGMNRYHEKEHGNFPYHIQHPDKESLMHREYEMGPEIIPKFITNRGKLPSELWNSGMQKRFGQGPVNIHSRSDHFINPDQPPQNQKILRRLQRTPVTTLQMLKQMPGIKTQKTQINREDIVEPTNYQTPPIYRTFADQPKKEENLYIVYPSKAPQKLQPDNGKVFIVSDTKSQKNFYNFTKLGDQRPLLSSNKRGNQFGDKSRNNFPYGFIKADERVKLNRKQQQKESEEDFRVEDTNEEETNVQEQKVLPPAPTQKDDKIDMNLHMQSNNQWNEVKTLPDSGIEPVVTPQEKFRNDHYRFSEQVTTEKDLMGTRINPPSEYHTSIKDDKDSAFTLGAIMHTLSETNRKGQVASVSLHNEEKELNLPKLDVNERISNGKIVTVSMPLDVKKESEEESSERYQFQAPFQASSSVTSNESHPSNQGWSVVKNPDDKSDTEEGKETSETSTTPKFSFENFKPELIGGFKPIYELPDEPEESKEQEKPSVTEREEKTLHAR